ncbi:hypothetical protein C0989_005704 [Termitomyces sp. Mn162]|nr:hypothetical protein C0989_005704 [Termitomyces sp. Mn162]
MDNAANECAKYADSNPDISGVGVRVSFYLQTFLLVLLVDRSWQNAPIALWTFIATSAGLVLAAIIIRDQLTLFQALQVSNLVWLGKMYLSFDIRVDRWSKQVGKFWNLLRPSKLLSTESRKP